MEPRLVDGAAMRLAGNVARHDARNPLGIPGQWAEFAPRMGSVPGKVGDAAYGAVYNYDMAAGTFDYLCGVEVGAETAAPEGMQTIDIPAQRYAVFHHAGHISGIRETITAIWTQYIPQSGLKPAPGIMLERYGPEFNGQTGLGGVEIWIPIGAD